MVSELDLALILCVGLLGGEVEVRQAYRIDAGRYHVRVDCLTEDHAIEVGLDGRRSSLDSVHQALFAAEVTGRAPMVIMIDTDGQEDRVEYQVRRAAAASGVAYRVMPRAVLERWRMTAPFRARRAALALRGGS